MESAGDTADLGKRPSRMSQADLGSAFNQPDRSSELAGRLTPLRAASPVVEPQTETEPPEVVTPVPEIRKTPVGRPKRRSTTDEPEAVSTTASGGVQTIVVYLAASVQERLRRARMADTADRSYAELVLDALDATHGRLMSEFPGAQRRDDSLFTTRHARRRRRHTEPLVQVSLRLQRDHLAVIDRLVVETNAPNRSALVSAALTQHLPMT